MSGKSFPFSLLVEEVDQMASRLLYFPRNRPALLLWGCVVPHKDPTDIGVEVVVKKKSEERANRDKEPYIANT